MKKHPLLQLAERFPQLYLPVKENMHKNILYQNIIKHGFSYKASNLDFTLDEKDFFMELDSPYGKASVLYLHNRSDFERFVRIMAYRCEPVAIPGSMGATIISGIVDWDKIKAHKEKYLARGNQDWKEELQRFTSNKKNYQTMIIVLCSGGYSGLSHEEVNYSKIDWERISLNIRLYHEYTHFIAKHRYARSTDPVYVEIVADCMGLIYAVGSYDVTLAKKFLGVEKDHYTRGRRLENYLKGDKSIEEIALETKKQVDLIHDNLTKLQLNQLDFLEILDHIYSL